MTFEQSILIDADAAALFELSQDYTRRLDWDPFLRSAELLNGAALPAVGVRALCVDRKGTAMETEYVSYNPPCAVAVKMTARAVVPGKLRRLVAIRAGRTGANARVFLL